MTGPSIELWPGHWPECWKWSQFLVARVDRQPAGQRRRCPASAADDQPVPATSSICGVHGRGRTSPRRRSRDGPRPADRACHSGLSSSPSPSIGPSVDYSPQFSSRRSFPSPLGAQLRSHRCRRFTADNQCIRHRGPCRHPRARANRASSSCPSLRHSTSGHVQSSPLARAHGASGSVHA